MSSINREVKKEIVDVIFRRFNSDNKEVIAIFPGIFWTATNVMSYMHVGQHSGCYYWGIIDKTSLIKDLNELNVKALKKELERLGYNLKVVTKMTVKHRRALETQQKHFKTIDTILP